MNCHLKNDPYAVLYLLYPKNTLESPEKPKNGYSVLVDGGGALLQERSERNDLELLQFVRLLYSSTQTPSNKILPWALFF